MNWNTKLIGIIVFFVFVLDNFTVSGQHIRQIGTEQGLRSRQTIQTKQDKFGFIWVSTKTGVDRLDGSNIKSFELPQILCKYAYENYYLAIDKDSLIWAFNDVGQVFNFNYGNEKFELFLDLNSTSNETFCWLLDIHFASNKKLYLATDGGFVKINPDKTFTRLANKSINEKVVAIRELSDDTLLLATFNRIYLFSINGEKTSEIKLPFKETFRIQSLYFDKSSETIWIGSFSDGVFSYNLSSGKFVDLNASIVNFPKVPIRSLAKPTANTIMVGSDGSGLWEIDTKKMEVIRILAENKDIPNQISGNGVYDVFIDNDKRIWICTYTGGLNIIESNLPNFRTIKKIPYNKQSLSDNNVNAVFEDSNGNIWFGTNNGISILKNDKKWLHLFERKDDELSVFLSFCEGIGGEIYASTYSRGVFILNKDFKAIDHLTTSSNSKNSIGTNYVFTLYRDKQNAIWIGGRDGYLCKLDPRSKTTTVELNIGVNSIVNKSENEIVVGGPQSLILYNIIDKTYKNIIEGLNINCVYVDRAGNMFFGTRGSGLQMIDLGTKNVKKFSTAEGLLSNHVNHIIPYNQYLWLSTENGLSRFDLINNIFSNYLVEDGISDKTFNRTSGCKLRNGDIIFGSNDGATWFNPNKISENVQKARIYLDELRLFNQAVFPNDLYSPLQTSIDSTKTLYLKHSQHSFSIIFTPVSFFNAGRIKSTWKLNGFDDQWRVPSFDKTINYTNLPPGKYILEIKVLDNALKRTLDYRYLSIIISPPFWITIWAKLLYLIVLLLLFRWIYLYLKTKVGKKHSDEKIAFFTNAAHDLRTPLSLVNAPLNELKHEPNLSEKGKYYLKLTLSSVEKFNNLVTQLLDFQKSDSFKDQLIVSRTDINLILSDQTILFRHFAASKGIQINFHPHSEPLFEWVDVAKMEKIIENLLSNAIKYTPKSGAVDLFLFSRSKTWTILVQDNGIGIPKKSQNKIFNAFFRGENAINSQVIGTGIGLLLTKSYVELHRGKIHFESGEGLGSKFRLIFKHGKKHFPTSITSKNDYSTFLKPDFILSPENELDNKHSLESETMLPNLLIVEDNEDLGQFLFNSLNELYNPILTKNGKEALGFLENNKPDIIVTDIRMPLMDGIELCRRLKQNFTTSHIPIVILSALSEKENLFNAFEVGIDDYLTKPFDMDILKIKLKNLLLNRLILRKRILAQLNETIEKNTFNNDLDQQFIEKAIELIMYNMSDSEFSVSKFASEMGVSKTILYNKLNALVGQTPNDFTKTIRIKHAMKILKEKKDLSISEIATLCGFEDPRYFSTCFKNVYGKTPSSYLKMK